jgi:hypothetical protein
MAGYGYIMGNGRIVTEHGQKALRGYNIAEKESSGSPDRICSVRVVQIE